jgi:hypothetical protein
MAKPLRHVTGVKSSKIEPMDLKDLDKSPDGAKLDAKYHKIEKHADRAETVMMSIREQLKKLLIKKQR